MKKIIEFFKRLFGNKVEVVKPIETKPRRKPRPKSDRVPKTPKSVEVKKDIELSESPKPKPKRNNNRKRKPKQGGSSNGGGRQPYNTK